MVEGDHRRAEALGRTVVVARVMEMQMERKMMEQLRRDVKD